MTTLNPSEGASRRPGTGSHATGSHATGSHATGSHRAGSRRSVRGATARSATGRSASGRPAGGRGNRRPWERQPRTAGDRVGMLGEALRRPLADYYMLLVPSALLLGLGMLMVLSSSSLYSQSIFHNPYSIAEKQMLFLLVGLPLGWWMSRCSEARLRRLSVPVLALALLLLLVVLSPVGTDIKGNKSWIAIPGLGTLQPSEFAKFALILYTAQVFNAHRARLDRIRTLVPALIAFLCVAGLIVAEHDLGTTLVVCAIFFALVWTAGINRRLLLAGAGVAGVVILGLVVTSPNRMRRIFAFTGTGGNDPNASQQPLASVYALATGGWTGKGLGQSQQKWGALADGAQNDFIFAVIGEELGLLGVLIVMLLLAMIGWAGFRTALRSETLFRRLVAAGCTAWLIIQAMINIGVAMRLLPVIGVPLPFLSAGGSALLATMLCMGVLMSCARDEPEARRVLARRRGEPAPRVTAVVDAGHDGSGAPE